MQNLQLYLERIATPIGCMLLVTDDWQRVRALDWEEYEARLHLLMKRQYKDYSITLIKHASRSFGNDAMHRYFDGEINVLQKIPTKTGGTDFQKLVWETLTLIEPGKPISYATLAAEIGKPAAVRAVGLANGANPIGIIVPCHRVIGSNKSLTGYGGGLERKKWLLNHELKAKNLAPLELF